MTDRSSENAPRRVAWWPAAVFLALAVLHTWPLATDPGRLSLHHDDEWLNAWAVSWIAHQLPREPFNLFDANIYYPTDKALAYTEPLIVPGLLGAPLRWLGASPMLTFNLLVLAGLVLTALAMYCLVVAWTDDTWAGLMAGAVLAFGTAMMTRLAHLQVLHLYSLPLGLLALDRLFRRGRAGDAFCVGLCVLCAALTSGYLVLFVLAALGGALLARAPTLPVRDGAAVLLRLSAAAVVTSAIAYVLLWPYLELQGPRPPTGDAAEVGSALASYLATAADLHYGLWSDDFFQRAPRALFPGAVALVLAGAAFAVRSHQPGGARSMLLGVAAMGLLLSLGPLTPFYEWASELFPPLRTVRAVSRFGILVVFAVAALAGLGLAALRRRLEPRWGLALSAASLAVVTVECFHAPIGYHPVDWNPPVHRALAAVEPGPIVELPLYRRFHRNAWYLLASTSHWRPMVAGFGNSHPPGYDELVRVVSTFPSVLAVARLQALGVPHAVVHASRHPRSARVRADMADLGGRSDLTLIAAVGPDRLFRIRAEPVNDLAGPLVDLPWDHLRLVGAADSHSYPSAMRGGRNSFGLQGANHFVAYVEDTTADASLELRPPAPMKGRILDALKGSELGRITVDPIHASEDSAQVPLPAGRRAVVVSLRMDCTECGDSIGRSGTDSRLRASVAGAGRN